MRIAVLIPLVVVLALGAFGAWWFVSHQALPPVPPSTFGPIPAAPESDQGMPDTGVEAATTSAVQ